MRAAVFNGPGDVEIAERPDPIVKTVRVPLAGSTLVKVPGSGLSDETLQSLLTLSDVMCTGRHAAVSAGVDPGSVVAIVGDRRAIKSLVRMGAV